MHGPGLSCVGAAEGDDLSADHDGADGATRRCIQACAGQPAYSTTKLAVDIVAVASV
jgi:hypothetical protein